MYKDRSDQSIYKPMIDLSRVINTYTDHNMSVRIIPRNDGIKRAPLSAAWKYYVLVLMYNYEESTKHTPWSISAIKCMFLKQPGTSKWPDTADTPFKYKAVRRRRSGLSRASDVTKWFGAPPLGWAWAACRFIWEHPITWPHTQHSAAAWSGPSWSWSPNLQLRSAVFTPCT